VTARALRLLLGGMMLLIATVTRAELRDLGTYGPTCPVPARIASPPGQTLRIEAGRARVAAPVEVPMPVAATRRAYVVPVRWPAGTLPVVAFVGHDAASLAVVRSLPPGTPVFVLPSDGEHGLEALRLACPACRLGIAGTAGARRLGIQAVPAVVRVVDGVPHVTEGAP
jgi:hypothetical protein